MFILGVKHSDYANILFLLELLPTKPIVVACGNSYHGVQVFYFLCSFFTSWNCFIRKACHFFFFYFFSPLFVYISMDSRISMFSPSVIINTIIGFMFIFILLKWFHLSPVGALSSWQTCFQALLFFSTYLLSDTTRYPMLIFHLPAPALESTTSPGNPGSFYQRIIPTCLTSTPIPTRPALESCLLFPLTMTVLETHKGP